MDRSKKLGKLSRGVSVIGCGATKIGSIASTPEIKGMTQRELWHWAAREAMEDANCQPEDIQGQYIGNTLGETFTHSGHLDGILQRWSGLKRDGLGVAGCRLESACSSGGHAIREAIFAIASGVYDVVLAGGVEILSSKVNSLQPASIGGMSEAEFHKLMSRGSDIAFHYLQESTVSLFGGPVVAYAHEYGLKIEDIYDMLDGIVISRYHSASHNPKISINSELDNRAKTLGFANAKELLHSKTVNPPIWWPIRFFDFAYQSDGAACVALCATEIAKEFHPDPIHVLGTGCSHGQLYNPTYSYPASVEAARQAYEMAGLTPGDIDFLEIHACNSGVEPAFVEDIGFCKRGEYWEIARDGRTGFDGDKPVSPGGGQQGLGNTIGANAGYQAYEIVKQIRGEAGSRQIHPIPKIGLAQTFGATGDLTAVILIYGRK